MSRTPSRFAIVEAEERFNGVDFVRRVARRFDRAMLALSIVLILVAQVAFKTSHLRGQAPNWNVFVPPTNWKFVLLMQSTFVFSLVVAALAADEAVALGARRRSAYVTALVVASTFAGIVQWLLNRWLNWIEFIVVGMPIDTFSARPFEFFVAALIFGGFGYSVYVNQRTARLAARRMQQAELERAAARRRTVESRLQALQARVEPQFLFNTLAQVGELYQRDPAMADGMLDNLIAYLRAALPHLRESTSTVARELDLARAYLDIMRIRLGSRLSFSFDVPEAARTARIPPMVLLPLVDHALVYGLQEGDGDGSIRITTTTTGGRLRLTIADNGAGLVAIGEGSGLTDMAERLRTIYGEEASFVIERIRGQGTSATLEIPYENADLHPA
ncbi:MAG: histidine kinase [Pseudomonadota bacterium]|nr:histidine kinase [Pseudomonadota bacterium]